MKPAPDRPTRPRRLRAAPVASTDLTPKAASHPYFQVALLILAALLLWKLAGVLLLLFSAILLAAALSAIADGLRKLGAIPAQVAVLLAALLMFGILAGVAEPARERCLERRNATTNPGPRRKPLRCSQRETSRSRKAARK
jgi:hypothetical protein